VSTACGWGSEPMSACSSDASQHEAKGQMCQMSPSGPSPAILSTCPMPSCWLLNEHQVHSRLQMRSSGRVKAEAKNTAITLHCPLLWTGKSQPQEGQTPTRHQSGTSLPHTKHTLKRSQLTHAAPPELCKKKKISTEPVRSSEVSTSEGGCRQHCLGLAAQLHYPSRDQTLAPGQVAACWTHRQVWISAVACTVGAGALCG
jgi:hypothetical protein